MNSVRLPSAAVGNGRLLVTLDDRGDILTACWPCIDSPNQLSVFRVTPTAPNNQPFVSGEAQGAQFDYLDNTNIFSAVTTEGLSVQDTVIDVAAPPEGMDVDVHVRKVAGPHPALTVYLAPELDGRIGGQTVYWDAESQALIAFCRHNWVAIGAVLGRVSDFHCGRRDDESSASLLLSDPSLPGERIAFRHVDAALRITESTESTILWAVYGRTREQVLGGLDAARTQTWPHIEQTARATARDALAEMTLTSDSAKVDRALRRSSLVLDLLTNRDTGGVIAGPNVQSGIASAPDYAAVWARDAAWTALGALALGRTKLAKRMLRFAITTQAPEGLWLHRHHSDHAVASSWGLHQIDETGILIHTIACYIRHTGDTAFAKESWTAVSKAASFLLHQAHDPETGLPIKSVDLWEEREGFHAYTAASVSAGLKAAATLAAQLEQAGLAQLLTTAAMELDEQILLRFWNPEQNRFVKSLQSSPALPVVDPERPDLPTRVQRGTSRPATALAQYPNWRADQIVDVDLAHDVSVLGLAVPFGVVPLDYPRLVSTVAGMRERLWSSHIGGMRRYEGDSYGGGNAWPLATLWLAIYESARGNVDEAHRLIEWVVIHSTAAALVPEQVHRDSGHPVAAVPLSWSHAMIAIAVAATTGKHVWRLADDFDTTLRS